MNKKPIDKDRYFKYKKKRDTEAFKRYVEEIEKEPTCSSFEWTELMIHYKKD